MAGQRWAGIAIAILLSGCIVETPGDDESRTQNAFRDHVQPDFPVGIHRDGDNTTYTFDYTLMKPTKYRLMRFLIVAYGNASVHASVDLRLDAPRDEDGCFAYGLSKGFLGQREAALGRAGVVWYGRNSMNTGVHAAGFGGGLDGTTDPTASGLAADAVDDFSSTLGNGEEFVVEIGTEDPAGLILSPNERILIEVQTRGPTYVVGEGSSPLARAFLECGVGAESISFIPNAAVQVDAGPSRYFVDAQASWSAPEDGASIFLDIPESPVPRTMEVTWQGRTLTNPSRLADTATDPGEISIRFRDWHETSQTAPRWAIAFIYWPAAEADR